MTLLDDLEGDHLHLVRHFVVAAAHETLDGEDGVLGVGDGLAFGHLAHQPFPALGECDDRGGSTRTLLIWNDFWFAAFHNGDARIGSSEIDSDDFSHVVPAFREDPDKAGSQIECLTVN